MTYSSSPFGSLATEKIPFRNQVGSLLVFFMYQLKSLYSEEHSDKLDDLDPSTNDDFLLFYIILYNELVNKIITENVMFVDFNGYAYNKELSNFYKEAISIYGKDDIDVDKMSPSSYKTSYSEWGEDKDRLVDKFSSEMLYDVFSMVFSCVGSKKCSSPTIENFKKEIKPHTPITEEILKLNVEKIKRLEKRYDEKKSKLFKYSAKYPDKRLGDIEKIDKGAFEASEELRNFENLKENKTDLLDFAPIIADSFFKHIPEFTWASAFLLETEENLKLTLHVQPDLYKIISTTIDFMVHKKISLIDAIYKLYPSV